MFSNKVAFMYDVCGNVIKVCFPTLRHRSIGAGYSTLAYKPLYGTSTNLAFFVF